MTGNTLTRHSADPTAPRSSASEAATLAPSRAARELGLKRGEFDLAVQLGRIRTVSGAARSSGPPGAVPRARWRVPREEIDRMRAANGFPETLRERVKAVGTTQGAELMGITTARFTRLARLGLLVPVKFYLNRYRTVVWLYLAEELRAFAENMSHRTLLTSRMPETLRTQLEAGVDLRARNWRGRHAGFLLRGADGPWARAAVTASLLDPAQVSDIVNDPYERAQLARLKPDRPAYGAADSPAARVVESLLTADDPDEIQWMRASLQFCIAEARNQRPLPRPEPSVPEVPEALEPSEARPRDETRVPRRGVLRWLRRRTG